MLETTYLLNFNITYNAYTLKPFFALTAKNWANNGYFQYFIKLLIVFEFWKI